jgi:hypothetical protein
MGGGTVAGPHFGPLSLATFHSWEISPGTPISTTAALSLRL